MSNTWPVKRLIETEEIQVGGLFEPSTVLARWRVSTCDSPTPILTTRQFEVFLSDYLSIGIMDEAEITVNETDPDTGQTTGTWVNVQEGYPADHVDCSTAALVGFEVIDKTIARNPDSNELWDVSARLQLVQDSPGRGHSLVVRSTSQRGAQAWRLNPFLDASPDPGSFWVAEGASRMTPLVCNVVAGDRCDVNGQPITVRLDQQTMRISFVIRAPHYINGVLTESPSWDYWTEGEGARSINNRNSADFNGWPAYSLIVDSIDVTQIGMTSFHRVDVTMLWDQWWHLEQIPVTFNGAMPPVVATCSGKVFQTDETLWLNPFCTDIDFNDLVDQMPCNAQAYINAATAWDLD